MPRPVCFDLKTSSGTFRQNRELCLMAIAVVRYIQEVLGVKSILLPEVAHSTFSPVAQSSWEIQGTGLAKLAWVRSRSPGESLFDEPLKGLVSRMTSAMKIPPSDVLLVECARQDIDEVLSECQERGIEIVILCGDEFESYLSSQRGELRKVQGLNVLRTLDPRSILTNESLKRPVWEDLKKVMVLRGAQ